MTSLNVPSLNLSKQRGKLIYGPLPPEAVESNTNRKNREKKQEMFRKLNNQNTRYNNIRATFKKVKGVNWKNAAANTKKLFQNEQNAKATKRFETKKKFRNAEWTRHTNEWKKSYVPPAFGSLIPQAGAPPRINFGYGGARKTLRHRR